MKFHELKEYKNKFFKNQDQTENYKKLQQELENIRDYIRGEYVPKTQYG